MATWTDEETYKLIELWGEDKIQAELEGCKRNAHIFEKIAREMAGAGFDRSGTQCRDKIKKLRAEYRKIKDKHGKTGTGRSSWKFFDDMDKILGHKPATCPPTVIDTSTDHTAPSTEVQISSEDNDNNEGNGELDILGDSAQASDSHHEPHVTRPVRSRSSTPTNQAPASKKPRKPSKIDQVAKAVREVVGGILEEGKEKMDKIEERRLELEEKMAEREMRFRQEQLEFQKQMFTTLAALLNRQGSTTNSTGHGVHQNHPMFGMSMDMPPESSHSHGMYHF